MATLRSPLRGAKADSVSACGKLLRSGQSIEVAESAIGQREKTLEARGKIKIRPSSKKGQVQVVCTLR